MRQLALPVLLLCVLTLVLMLIANGMVYPINHDEQQYVAAAYASLTAEPYRDFIYLQTPYFPIMLGWFYQVFEVEQYFLAGRWFNVGCSILMVALVGLLSWRLSGQRWLGLACAALVATSSVMQFSMGVVRNDILPDLFQLLSLTSLLWWQRSQSGAGGTSGSAASVVPSWSLLLAGLWAALAVGTKISYVYLPLALLLVSGWQDWRQRRLQTGWLIAGGILGGLPILWYAWLDWYAFWYGNLGYHTTAPLEWYQMRGLADRLTLGDRLYRFVKYFIISPATVATALFLLLILVKGWKGRITQRARSRLLSHHDAIIPLALVFAIPMCIMPNPTWIQYFVPLLPLLVLMIPWLNARLRETEDVAEGRVGVGGAEMAILGLGVLIGAIPLASQLPALLDREQWADVPVRRVATAINQVLPSDVTGQVVTFAPMHVLESSARPINELISGPFFYRTAHLLSAAQVADLGGLAPASVSTYMETAKPWGILVGAETDPRRNLDADLIAVAERLGYRAEPVVGTEFTLYRLD